MKTKIVIEQGKVSILLTSESEFERDLIEKVVDSKMEYKAETNVLTNCSYHTHSNHRIEINLIEQTDTI